VGFASRNQASVKRNQCFVPAEDGWKGSGSTDLASRWSSTGCDDRTQLRRAVASLLARKRIAILRTHLPPQPNPHNRVRGTFRASPPAGSFLGGFRTPGHRALGSIVHGRHPKPCTEWEELTTNMVGSA
jgi:hypothetical protein